MKIRKSTQVAVGGLSSALCLLLMFMTGMIPFATFALPSLAGILLIVVVVENGIQTATLGYASVSILSLFMCPDKELLPHCKREAGQNKVAAPAILNKACGV